MLYHVRPGYFRLGLVMSVQLRMVQIISGSFRLGQFKSVCHVISG
jgi:hypothetical protein